MNAMTKGCLAGTGVCFISHEGEVFPCGYLPAIAGDLRKEKFADIWANAKVFNDLRDTGNLKGKCGCCEFRNVCMGCRARAFAATGDYLDPKNPSACTSRSLRSCAPRLTISFPSSWKRGRALQGSSPFFVE